MVDVLNNVLGLITTNWTAANTNNVTPMVDEIFNQKRVILTKTAVNDGDTILAYMLDSPQTPSGVNSTHVNKQHRGTIDMRTMVSRAHALLLRDEIVRILGTKFRNPFGTMGELEILDEKDLSDKTTGLWRFIFEFEYRTFHVPR